ncbi:MAG: Hsp20/alpha crystallin family protein [Oligoflexia bacterium]|nr:Hsp20/alpha crystallin family protein [Oligoflexia bacterium]
MNQSNTQEKFRRPNFDIMQSSAATVVVADFPGVQPEGLEITVEAGQMTICGRPSFTGPDKLSLLREELESAPFKVSFRVPETLDADAAEAKLRDGVLRLSLPVRRQNGLRKISVRSEQ